MNTPSRMTSKHAALLIVDMQEKLVPLVQNPVAVTANCARLIRAADLLKIPVWGTEQYPKGLGPFVPELAELVPKRAPKTAFSCLSIPDFVEQIHGRKIEHVTLAGIETHVCILHTAIELLNKGLAVQVPADSVSSRHELDWSVALRRLEASGAVVTTTETVMFEWIETSEHPKFKQLSELVKNHFPGARFGF